MGGDCGREVLATTVRRFNPRPRMGGDDDQVASLSVRAVSIHAPAWGATNNPAKGF